MTSGETLSIEVFHACGIWDRDSQKSSRDGAEDDLLPSRIDELARRSAEVSKEWLTPFLERDASRCRTCMLLDDYFRYGNGDAGPSPNQVASRFQSAYEAVGMPLDFVISEEGLSHSVAELTTTLAPGQEPISPEALLDGSWLGNGEPGPPGEGAKPVSDPDLRGGFVPPARSPDAAARPVTAQGYFRTRRQHSIRIDVEITAAGASRKRPFSCAVLAAWWQLLRLGVVPARVLRDHFADAILIGELDSIQTFACTKTLSLLPYDLIDVEAAVRVILENISAPPESWTKATLPLIKFQNDLLARIAYLFVPQPVGI